MKENIKRKIKEKSTRMNRRENKSKNAEMIRLRKKRKIAYKDLIQFYH